MNIVDMHLWDKKCERMFFKKFLLEHSPDELFYYTKDNHYYAYWPKSYKGRKYTLQSRNAFIGDYTEKFVHDLLSEYARSINCYAVRKVICKEIELSKDSPADVAICKENKQEQKPEDIKIIIEVKMSLVWNWKLTTSQKIRYVGDYTTHKGTPSFLRSDTMLKAIGKAINIRISSNKANYIPIIIIGNTPITETYRTKVDNLREYGIVQGFWSINPSPLDNNGENIKDTIKKGFIRIDNYDELVENINRLLSEDRKFFSGMKSNRELGRLIESANKEVDIEKKAERFLELLRESHES
ncbi:hypothetical protein [Melioribacter sp. OK-6-Me]|uniref:hypothetical protein n=1 Tax=unclassified Melioribacter TaxID=2627329 RepID=UPI003EDA0961